MNMIMAFGTGIFFILFLFIFFLATIVVIGIFKKVNHSSFKAPISVVIPAYNEAKNIAECLGAIQASRYKDLEIIVVDDGSHDETQRIARSFGAKVIIQKHLGKVAALNRGAKESTHEFIVTIDADTIVEPDFFINIIAPFSDLTVGATSGSARVKNRSSILGMYQNLEYHHNNLLRNSFTRVFGDGIWFFGAVGCYRKKALEEVGGFKENTMSEDMDVTLDLKRAGYKTKDVSTALAYTIVPTTFSAFLSQRRRWWIGVVSSLWNNKKMFLTGDLPTRFLFCNQFWWSIYAWISLPLIAYQVYFWLPTGGVEIASYIFRWFSAIGPLYVIYKIPEWGINLYSIFGVLSGIVSISLLLYSIRFFHDQLTPLNVFGVFFYFPYTLFLNTVIILSFMTAHHEKRHFIK